jgi:hypothetical protein
MRTDNEIERVLNGAADLKDQRYAEGIQDACRYFLRKMSENELLQTNDWNNDNKSEY